MQQRSTFVTVIGWIFVALSAFLLLDALTVAFTPADMVLQSLRQEGLPSVDPGLLQHAIHGTAVAVSVIMIWVLLSAIGLLRRKNWARVSFSVMLSLGTAFWLLYLLSALVNRNLLSASAMGQSLVVVLVVVCVLFIAFFAWVLFKLNTPKVKQEFLPPSSSQQ